MSIAACAEIVRRGDPDRFLATMAGSTDARERLFPLYAMNVEVSRAPWVSREPLIAEMRLQWWLDALDEIAGGRPVRHEVTTPLSAVITPEQAKRLKSLVKARRWDVAREPFPDLAALFSHIDATSGILCQVAMEALGSSAGLGGHLGFAQGAAAWLVAVPRLLAEGRFPLPGDGHEAARDLAREGLRRYGLSRTKGEAARKAIPVLWAGFSAPYVLKLAQNDPQLVFEGRLSPSGFRRRLRLLSLVVFRTW